MSGERGKSKSRGGSPCPLPLLITSSRETQRDKKESQTAEECCVQDGLGVGLGGGPGSVERGSGEGSPPFTAEVW